MASDIIRRLAELKEIIPAGIELVAVSKFHPVEAVREAYDGGQRIFGESRVQELLAKIPQLPSDIRWHFIGHLQSNKVRQLIGNVSLIESVDSEKLLDLIDAESRKKDCMSRVLLQVHVAREETKFGFYPEEIMEYFNSRKFENLTNTHICGLMAMASNIDSEERIRQDFSTVANIMKEIKKNQADLRGFDILSMGMSGDWPIAVEEGANMIRIGSAIFGERV